MIVTHKISLDMTNAGEMPCVEAVQDVRYTRDVTNAQECVMAEYRAG